MANQAKVHIRPDGSLGTCEAEYQCKYAREDPRGPHFDTFEEAAMWLETEAEALEDCKMLVEGWGEEEGLTPGLMEAHNITPWTLHRFNPDKYPNPGLEGQPTKKEVVEQQEEVAEEPVEASVPEIIEPAEAITGAGADATPESTKVAHGNPEPSTEETDSAAETVAVASGATMPDSDVPERDRGGWINPEDGQFTFDFDVSAMRIERPMHDLGSGMYWEPETYEQMVDEAVKYASWDEEELCRSFVAQAELDDSGLDGYMPVSGHANSVLDGWVMRNIDKPVDQEAADAALEDWAATPRGRGRFATNVDNIDSDNGFLNTRGGSMVIEYDIPSSVYLSEGDYINAAYGDEYDGYAWARMEIEETRGWTQDSTRQQDYIDSSTYAGYVERKPAANDYETDTLTRVIDPDGSVAVVAGNGQLTQKVAKRKYHSQEYAEYYRDYRWSERERKEVNDFLGGEYYDDEVFSKRERAALNKIRRFNYQSSVINSQITELLESKSDEDVDKLDALCERIDCGNPDYLKSFLAEGLLDGSLKIRSKGFAPTLDDIVPGNPSRDSMFGALRSLDRITSRNEGYSGRGSLDDVFEAAAARVVIKYDNPDGPMSVRRHAPSRRSTILSTFTPKECQRDESLMYMKGNHAGFSLSRSANRTDANSLKYDTGSARYGNDFVVTYEDEGGATRFGYAPQGAVDGTVDIVHLPASATLVDKDGFEFPDPYYLKAARAEYFFGGTEFKPGDLENIVVNDDDSTTSRFKLRLW